MPSVSPCTYALSIHHTDTNSMSSQPKDLQLARRLRGERGAN
jgi:hypothetical protein